MHIKRSEFGFSVLVESTGKQIMQPLEGGGQNAQAGMWRSRHLGRESKAVGAFCTLICKDLPPRLPYTRPLVPHLYS